MKELSTQLIDRKLRYDGVSVIEAEMVAQSLLRGVAPSFLRVQKMNWEVEQFNLNVPDELCIQEDHAEPVKLDLRWKLPEKYMELNLENRIVAAFMSRSDEFLRKYGVEQYDEAIVRIAAEVEQIQLHGMVEFFKTVIYILDTFKEKGVIWGVGRGSSCACYILFILGLHAVDCIKLDVPMSEFFHD